MMNKRRQRYCNLRTMSELHKERMKLNMMMKANKANIEEDWDEVCYWLSPANIVDEVMDRMCHRSSIFRNLIAGVRTAMAMIRGRK